MQAPRPRARGRIRPAPVGAGALAAGLAIAWIDSSPRWDDTGIIAGLLLVVAAITAGLDPRRAWLHPLLVGAPLALVEAGLRPDTWPTPLAALLVAAIGSLVGWSVARARRGSTAGGGPSGRRRP